MDTNRGDIQNSADRYMAALRRMKSASQRAAAARVELTDALAEETEAQAAMLAARREHFASIHGLALGEFADALDERLARFGAPVARTSDGGPRDRLFRPL